MIFVGQPAISCLLLFKWLLFYSYLFSSGHFIFNFFCHLRCFPFVWYMSAWALVLIFHMLILPMRFLVQAETVLCVFTFFHPLRALLSIKGNSCKTLMQWLHIGALTDMSLPAVKSFYIIIIGCWSRQISPMDLSVSVLQWIYMVALWGHYLTVVDVLFNFHTKIKKFTWSLLWWNKKWFGCCDLA